MNGETGSLFLIYKTKFAVSPSQLAKRVVKKEEVGKGVWKSLLLLFELSF